MEADELKEKQKAFKRAAKQIKGKDAKLKLEGIAACSVNSFLVEVGTILILQKEVLRAGPNLFSQFSGDRVLAFSPSWTPWHPRRKMDLSSKLP
jgi:hypothetical protein